MIKNILYSICLHLFFLLTLYLGIKNIDYLHQEQVPKGVSIGLKEVVDKKKSSGNKKDATLPKKPKSEALEKKEIKKPIKQNNKKHKSIPPNKKTKIKKDIRLPTTQKTTKKKIVKYSQPEDSKEEPLSIKKIYQNDVYIDDIDSLNLSSTYTRSIKNHLNFCFSSILENQDNNLEMIEEIEISFHMTKNGVIKLDFKKNTDEKLLKNEKFANYKKIIDKIARSTKKCAIFRNLPSNKYEIWREFKVLFTSKK